MMIALYGFHFEMKKSTPAFNLIARSEHIVIAWIAVLLLALSLLLLLSLLVVLIVVVVVVFMVLLLCIHKYSPIWSDSM